MKNLKHLSVYVGVVAAILLFFTRCAALMDDITNVKQAMDSINLVSNPELTTGVHVIFIDAKTNQTIAATATISGQDSSAIYNNIGEKLSEYPSAMGILDLVVDPHKIDSTTISDNPLVFNITATLSGYINVTQSVSINSSGYKTVIVPMISTTNTPEGVTAQENAQFITTDASGKVTATATSQLNSGAQTISIPAGTMLKDASGNALIGTVKSQIVYYNPTSDSAQNSIPGGTNISATLSDGSTEPIQFVSAGMFTVGLTVGGKSVKSFENGGLTLSTVVPEGVINPNTGQTVKEGDVVEFWSKEDGTDRWVFDKMDTVRLINGKLVLNETVKHLSTWNWDFYYRTCSYGPKINFTGNLSGIATILTRATNSGIYGSYGVYQYVYPNTYPYAWYYNSLQIYRAPSGVSGVISFKSLNSRYTVSPSSINISNYCNGGTYNVNITDNISSSFITVNTYISVSPSSQSKLVLKPNVYAYLYPTNSYYYYSWTSIYLSNGITQLSLQLGQEYVIFAYYGNKYGIARLKVEDIGNSQLKVTLTPSIVYVSGKYSTNISSVSYTVAKPANNIITVKYKFTVPDNIFSKLK